MTYPTAADLRAATNEAILRRCDDPLLGVILKAASESAATGAMCCRMGFAYKVEGQRRNNVLLALNALGVRAEWNPYDPDAASASLLVSWE